jgi:hypothetical protein
MIDAAFGFAWPTIPKPVTAERRRRRVAHSQPCQDLPRTRSPPAMLQSHDDGLLVPFSEKGETPMSSTLSPTKSEFSAARWATEAPVDSIPRAPNVKNAKPPRKQPSFARRFSRGVVRFLITFCIGVAATLAWQSYGDAARQMIATSSEQLAWLAPPPAPGDQAAPPAIAPAPPAPSPDLEQLKTVSLGLAAIRQSVDQLATQVAAGQEQVTRDISKLQAAEDGILHKISEPPPRPAVALPARKPPPAAPPQPAPVR